MAYLNNMPEAARRHLEAADLLYTEPGVRRDVAGYLYGIAAECALKHISRNPHLEGHFPELKRKLRDHFRGRGSTPRLINRFVQPGFMADWHITMRYADAAQIDAKSVERWQNDARAVIKEMGTT